LAGHCLLFAAATNPKTEGLSERETDPMKRVEEEAPGWAMMVDMVVMVGRAVTATLLAVRSLSIKRKSEGSSENIGSDN